MEIKTKYNMGDSVYYIEKNNICKEDSNRRKVIEYSYRVGEMCINGVRIELDDRDDSCGLDIIYYEYHYDDWDYANENMCFSTRADAEKAIEKIRNKK